MTMHRRHAALVRSAIAAIFLIAASPALAQGSLLGAIEDPYPLRAADTGSPRDTLRSFIRDVNAAWEAWEAGRDREYVLRLLTRAGATMDDSELPTLRRLGSLLIRIALLKEVLDRIEIPPFDRIPNGADIAENGIERWTLPNTQIEIARVEDGPRMGQFLFTKETVADLFTYYDGVIDLPYKDGAIVGFYDYLRTSGGSWLPRNFNGSLPGWANEVVFGQGVWQWIALAAWLVIGASVASGLYRAGRGWDRRQADNRPKRKFGIPLALLAIVGGAELFWRVTISGIGLFGLALDIVSYLTLAIQVGGLAIFTVVSAGRLAVIFAYSHDEASESKTRADAALLRVVFRLISIVALVYLAIYAAEAVGIPLAPLVAGLGVGGLAIALAVRPTLENVIGGLTLFADRPVRVGDFCRYGDQIGTVERIGLRSTRIRSLERTIVSVPNAEFSQMQIDNFAVRDRRLFKTVIQLRYETTSEQLRYVLAELRKLLLGHPRVTPEPARVRFVGYGPYSKDLEVFAYLRCRDQDTFLAIQEDLLLRIEDIVVEAGSGFAFPSQTTYFLKDGGLDEERARKAEEAVEDWRSQDRLPFPEFNPGDRWEMEDVLDYPPEGAHDHLRRKGVPEESPPRRPAEHSQPLIEPDATVSEGTAPEPPDKADRESRVVRSREKAD